MSAEDKKKVKSSDLEESGTGEKPVEESPIQGSLLGRAQIEQVDMEAALSDDEVDLMNGHIESDDELEEEEKPKLEPFTPPLADDNSNEIDFGQGFEDSVHHEADDNTDTGVMTKLQPQQSNIPEEYLSNDQQAGGSGYHDVFGMGSLGASLFGNLPSFKKKPEQIREKAAENYQKQQKKLDELIFNAKNKGADISASHVGKLQQGFIEQGVTPPVEAMQSAFALDKESQRSWSGMQKDLEKIEELSTRMQKTSVQAGFDHESSAQDIESRITEFHQELSEDLEGITDEKGNSLTDRIAESTRRVQEILKKILESLASLVGIDASKGQSQAAG